MKKWPFQRDIWFIPLTGFKAIGIRVSALCKVARKEWWRIDEKAY